MVTELESAVWACADALRGTRFSRILRNARIAHRDTSLPGPDDDEMQGWELSFDPAIQRTMGAVTALAMMHKKPPATDSAWLNWNLDAKKAMARVAAKCWAGIDSQRRAVFVDEDNFQPIWGHANLYDLRSDTPGRHLDFEELGSSDVRAALKVIYEATRATPAYEDALRADRELAQSRDKVITWARLAQEGHAELREALDGLVIQDGRRRGEEIVRSLYADTPVEGIAAAFRRYNKLVQQVVWSILGLAEASPDPLVLRDPIGTLRCTHDDDGSPFIRVTSTSASEVFLRLTYPIWLDTGTPLDGLHLLIGITMTLGPASACDLSLTPIRWSAGLWST